MNLIILMFIVGFQLTTSNAKHGFKFLNPIPYQSNNNGSTALSSSNSMVSSNTINTTISSSYNPTINFGNRVDTTASSIDYGTQISGVTISLEKRSVPVHEQHTVLAANNALAQIYNEFLKPQLQLLGLMQKQTNVQTSNFVYFKLNEEIQSLNGVRLVLTLTNNFLATRGINELIQIENQISTNINCDDMEKINYQDKINNGKNEFKFCINTKIYEAEEIYNKTKNNIQNVEANLEANVNELIDNCNNLSETSKQTNCLTNAITKLRANTINYAIQMDELIQKNENLIDSIKFNMSKCNQDINRIINEEKLKLTQTINNCNMNNKVDGMMSTTTDQ